MHYLDELMDIRQLTAVRVVLGGRQTDRQTDRDRQRDKQTEIQREIHTETKQVGR